MSLFMTIFLLWALALGIALLEGTLEKKKGKRVAQLVHLVFLAFALVFTGQVIWRLLEALRNLALN